ncbi:NAD-dependent epimerase/dehydratase family protein [Pontibacter sp. G13]|uniref:NAD-dependent epimerase/dehydratase family protein n=1 Tax=Pontibacter sp. G13 TaxID=3074898 RepID=UPI00288B8ABB|nr:NAD-dependent epimerase/dehydratase family protein [Pontibacter sp. G13]WNJ18095.1 NAD-dependent epimerase/dehydratase family protein [Pontibacter sp. G13]
MKRVFVTGGDGLLGSNLVRELISREYQVTVLVQPGRVVNTLDGLPIERVEGDLLDKAQLLEATKGFDYIIHVAAITAVWPSRGELYKRVNVDGVRTICEVALENKVERLVHVGSASSFGFGTKEAPGNEDSPWKSAQYKLDNIDTKSAGQKIVLKMVEEQGLPAVIVNPTFMIGPYDSKPSSGAMIVATYKQLMPGVTNGGKNWVYVKDVAVGISNALTMGRVGQCYILGHQNLSYKEAIQLIAKIVGKPAPTMSLPNFAVKTFGMLGTIYGNITNKAPRMTINMAKVACDGHYFSPAKAVKELALPQTPIEDAIQEAFDWFKANGYLD